MSRKRLGCRASHTTIGQALHYVEHTIVIFPHQIFMCFLCLNQVSCVAFRQVDERAAQQPSTACIKKVIAVSQSHHISFAVLMHEWEAGTSCPRHAN